MLGFSLIFHFASICVFYVPLAREVREMLEFFMLKSFVYSLVYTGMKGQRTRGAATYRLRQISGW